MDLFHVAAAQEDFPPIPKHAGFGAKLADEFQVDDQPPGDEEERISQRIPDFLLRHADLDDRSILQVQVIVMRAALRILDLIRKQHLLNAGGTDNMHPPPSALALLQSVQALRQRLFRHGLKDVVQRLDRKRFHSIGVAVRQEHYRHIGGDSADLPAPCP